jgi:hypothetical protein
MVYNFQIKHNKIKLLTKYENVTQNVLMPIESKVQSSKQLNIRTFHGIWSLEIIGHGNPDNNLEQSPCTYVATHDQTCENNVGFYVLRAAVMKSSIFWDIIPCSPLKINRRFGGTFCLYL